MACHTTSSLMTRSSSSAWTAPTPRRLSTGSLTARLWFLQNGLQLNADKSEVVLLGTPAQLRSATNITTVDVARSTLPVASKLKSLGVTIDSNLRFGSTVMREMLQRPATSTFALCATCAVYTSDVASRQRLRSSSRLHLVAARSAVGHSPLLVRWPGMRCLMTSETHRSVPTISGRS